MNTITSLFNQAQLAEAAYVNFFDDAGSLITNNEQLTKALTNSKVGGSFSTTQAADFVTHWRVVSQQPDTLSGFSATLFQRMDADPAGEFQAGQYYYAVRGTAGPSDLATDGGDIVLDGLALDQIVDMYNDWQRLNTAAGQTYQAAQLVTVDAMTTELQQSVSEWAMYESNPLVNPFPAVVSPEGLLAQWANRTDIVVDKPSNTVRSIQFMDSAAVFTDVRSTGANVGEALMLSGVTGHSLGGHLAAAFTRLFPGTADATTINGAGFPTGSLPGLGFFAETNIRNLFGMLGGAADFNAAAITNIHGDGPNFVTMNSQYGLVQQGDHQEIYIESMGPDVTFGHGKEQMTDSLAVYNLFAQLDPALNSSPSGLATITNILKAANNVPPTAWNRP